MTRKSALAQSPGWNPRSFNAGLSVVAAIMVGVVNAVGGGLLRDVLVREEPLMFKPGQLYVLAALLAAALFSFLVVRQGMPTESAAWLAIGSTFVFRTLAIVFKWKTISVSERIQSISADRSARPGGDSATEAPSSSGSAQSPKQP